MAPQVKITVSPPRGDRIYHINEDDVRVVLNRLPSELYHRLRAVHFKDRSWGGRILGYVTRSRREICLCALPPRMTMARFIVRGDDGSPSEYGAVRGVQWPAIAIRRFMLYNVLLHELGHLQVIDKQAKFVKQKFAGEWRARQFASHWRRRLWSQPFKHPDNVHHPPGSEDHRFAD